MHELGITKTILAVVLDRARDNSVQKVLSVRLAVGQMSDLEDVWLQRYFDHLSAGTVAEGAELRVSRIPVRFQCAECGEVRQFDIHGQSAIRCPSCGSDDLAMVSGDEYTIEDMEVI
jgi:hydrogenase nickel incorporation protein HypA/HybF